MEYPQLKTLIMMLRTQEQPNHVLIEDGASGQQLLQELRQAGVPGVHACKPQKDKAMRLMEVSAIIEAGQVLLPKEAPWLDAFESEFAYFPNGRHDDQVDSTSQALKWFMEKGRVAPILQFLRSEGLAGRAAAEDELVRVRPSLGSNTFIGRSGRSYMVDAEGVFALPRRELPLQLPFGWTMESA